MRPYDITGIDLLKTMLAACSGDDLSKPWSDYHCIEWPRGRTSAGYPTLFHVGLKKKLYVTRLALALSTDVNLEGLYACHHCDNPPCIRPVHLFPGDNSKNIKDCIAKGRFNRPHGSNQFFSKLNEQSAKEIRSLRGTGISAYKLSARYNVSPSVVYSIWQFKAWKHVT